MTTQNALSYRPEIDGLRGLAILSVLAHHVDPHVLPGGYVGVDIFFVISGFLITTIIRRDLESGVFSFRNFYARRVKRLVPAALVMGATSLAVGAAMLLPRDYMNLGGSVAAYMAMVSNVVFWSRDGYFEAQNYHWPLLHTWSLAVEEHFYLVFPAFLLIASRLRIPRTAILITALASFGWSEWRAAAHGSDAYYLLPSRAWELLCGAGCAYVATPQLGRTADTVVGILAMLAIVLPMKAFDETTAFPGIHAALPVVGTAIILLLTFSRASVWRRFLALEPLTTIGRISYSLYLWHWPLLIFAKYPWSASPDACPRFVSYAAGVAALPIAWVSFRYVETPGRSVRWTDSTAIMRGAIASVVLAASGATVYALGGLPSRLPVQGRLFNQSIGAAHPRQREAMGLDAAAVRAGAMVPLGPQGSEISHGFVLWGDSHADALVPAFDSLAERYGVSGQCFCRAATPPLSGIPFTARAGGRHFIDKEFAEAVCERITAAPPHCVVLAAHWTGLLMRGQIPTFPPGSQSLDEKGSLLAAALRSTIAKLEAAGVKRIWILRNVPLQPFSVPRQLAMSAMWRRPMPEGISREQHAQDAAPADRALAMCASDVVSIIDLPEAIFAEGNGILSADGIPLYADSHHLSVRGAEVASVALEPIFQELMSAAK